MKRVRIRADLKVSRAMKRVKINPDRPATTGRPCDYRRGYDRIVYGFALLGATDQEMCAALGVTTSTLYLWKTKFASFSESIRRGKLPADAKVAASLFRKATGYRRSDGVWIEPDTRAAIFWLTNRRRGTWSERKEIGTPDGPLANVKINVHDPVEASRAYQRLIAGIIDPADTDDGSEDPVPPTRH